MTRPLHTVSTVLFAGALATVIFDAFGQGISPLFGFARLAPVGLAGAVLNTVFGANPAGAAHLLHVLTGLVGYPLGWLLVVRPIRRAVAPGLPVVAPAVAYGIGLWVFALYVMAHLVAGNPAFLGFTGITWVALWGHILFALVAALVIEARLPAPARAPAATPANA